MKFFFACIILFGWSQDLFASELVGKLELTLGQKTSSIAVYADRTFKSKNGFAAEKTAKLNEKNFKYFSAQFAARKLLPTYPVQGCLREKVTLTVSNKNIQSCLRAKNKTARSLTELSNRLRFLM